MFQKRKRDYDTKSHCCCAKAVAQHAANSRIRAIICSIGNGKWYDTIAVYSETTLKRYVALWFSSALPFRSPPVGGSRNEGATLKRSASHLDKQMILKLTGYSISDFLYIAVTRPLAENPG
jgi:hypothetical protein